MLTNHIISFQQSDLGSYESCLHCNRVKNVLTYLKKLLTEWNH